MVNLIKSCFVDTCSIVEIYPNLLKFLDCGAINVMVICVWKQLYDCQEG